MNEEKNSRCLIRPAAELGATSTMQSLCTSTFSANPKPGLGARGHGQILLDACLVRCGAITLHTALSPKDIGG